MSGWQQHIVHSSERGRIVCMDSIGYVDERNDITDVLVCGSHGAPCATQLAVWLRPRGIICHDAGLGVAEGGAAGLKLLEAYRIPGAVVAGMSARISDGVDMYDSGTISRTNGSAERMGVTQGMATRDAALALLNGRPQPEPPPKRQYVMHDSALGRVYALDTVKYADERIRGGVLCMGAHAARAMALYVNDLALGLAGVITNDAGMAKDRSGVAGLAMLDESRLPAAAVSVQTARMGDARATYLSGRISAHNQTAGEAGVHTEQPAREAAECMLRFARSAASNR